MGSDADYLSEIGLDCVNQGDIPDSWDDNHRSRNQPISKQVFSDFSSAKSWAQANPGKVFVRSPNGNGFVEK